MIFAELKYIRQDNNKNCSGSKLSCLCYVICSTWFSTENYFVLAREKLHDFCTSMCWRSNFSIEVVDALCFIFAFQKFLQWSAWLIFMQIFVYLISFVRGMQDVSQHHIWRLDCNCNHSVKIWRKRKFKIRTLLFPFQWSWKKFLSGFNTHVVNL